MGVRTRGPTPGSVPTTSEKRTSSTRWSSQCLFLYCVSSLFPTVPRSFWRGSSTRNTSLSGSPFLNYCLPHLPEYVAKGRQTTETGVRE